MSTELLHTKPWYHKTIAGVPATDLPLGYPDMALVAACMLANASSMS
jgi:hypothetical protein